MRPPLTPPSGWNTVGKLSVPVVIVKNVSVRPASRLKFYFNTLNADPMLRLADLTVATGVPPSIRVSNPVDHSH